MANSNAPAVETSSHWTSSSAISNGPWVDASRRTVSAAANTARGSGGGPTGSARRRATSRAFSCGRVGARKTFTSSVQQIRQAGEGRAASDSRGLGHRQHAPAAFEGGGHTWVPERRLPIPDAPSNTSAAGPSTTPSRNASSRESSSTLPTTWFRLEGPSGVIAAVHAPLPGRDGQTIPIRGRSRVLQPCHAGRSSGGHRACRPSDRGGRRPRCDGGGLPGSPSPPGAPGRLEGPGPGVGRRRRVPGAIHPRVPGRCRARPSQHRHRVRRRRSRRRPLPLHAIRGRDRPRAAAGNRGDTSPPRSRSRSSRNVPTPSTPLTRRDSCTAAWFRRRSCSNGVGWTAAGRSSPTSGSRSTSRRPPG